MAEATLEIKLVDAPAGGSPAAPPGPPPSAPQYTPPAAPKYSPPGSPAAPPSSTQPPPGTQARPTAAGGGGAAASLPAFPQSASPVSTPPAVRYAPPATPPLLDSVAQVLKEQMAQAESQRLDAVRSLLNRGVSPGAINNDRVERERARILSADRNREREEERRKFLGRVAGGVATAGEAAAGVGGLDASATINALGKVADVALPGFGRALGAATAAAKAYDSAVKATLNQLAPYSGILSTSQARAEVNQIQGDFRRAQLLGPELASYNDATSKLSQNAQDEMAKALKAMLPGVTRLVEGLDQLLTTLGPVLTAAGAGGGTLLGWFGDGLKTIDEGFNIIGEKLGLIRQEIVVLGKKNDGDGEQLWLDDWLAGGISNPAALDAARQGRAALPRDQRVQGPPILAGF